MSAKTFYILLFIQHTLSFSINSNRTISDVSVKDLCKNPELYRETFGCQCIKPKPLNWPAYQASIGEFPFAAALYYEQHEALARVQCNGVLINHKFILTAAHCISKRSSPSFVQLGKTLLDQQNSDDSSPIVNIAIKKMIRHPDYEPLSKAKKNDIGLIELETAVDFSDKIRPACLYHEATNVQRDLIHVAWGKSIFNGVRLGDDEVFRNLLKTNKNEVLNQECSKGFEGLAQFPLSHNQLCAKHFQGNDLCAGSSGSFLGTSEAGFNVVHGITLFGAACGAGPTVFSRVAEYIDWIEDIAWSNGIHNQNEDQSTDERKISKDDEDDDWFIWS